MYTTNYQNTFIQIADDCDSKKGIVPPNKKIITIANIQYELIINNSYRFTSDDILFICYLKKNGINFEYVNDKNSITERENFFLKNKPCLRTSPLPKKYGWGIHFDANSKIFIYGCESIEYKNLLLSDSVRKIKAMRTKK